MTKVVVGSLHAKAKERPRSVTEKRIKSRSGKVITLRTIDADSRTFGSDLEYVFKRNVAKARRENKKVTGSSDSAVKV
jgi:hypothetical protein